MFELTYVGPAPDNSENEIYNLSADPEEMATLETMAKERGMDLNAFVVYLLEEAIKPENIEKVRKLIDGNNCDGSPVCG